MQERELMEFASHLGVPYLTLNETETPDLETHRLSQAVCAGLMPYKKRPRALLWGPARQ